MNRPCRFGSVAVLVASLYVLPAGGQTLASSANVLSFPTARAGARGILIHSNTRGAADVSSAQPVQLLVCGPCNDQSVNQTPVGAAYASVKTAKDGVLATARVNSPAGSQFEVQDHYRTGKEPGTFTVERTVTVVAKGDADSGFNSQFVLGFSKPVPIERYHFLAPGIWYDKNTDVAHDAIASRYSDQYFYWRETRSPLPFVMMQDPSTGTALSIAHINSTPHSGANERSDQWLTDALVQYGSLGAQRVPQMMLGFIYPAEEGEINYVGGRKNPWARRSHPVRPGFAHTYTLALGLNKYAGKGGGADYDEALAQTWRMYFNLLHPKIADVPTDTVYKAGINLLNHYAISRGGGQGFPFNVNLPDGSVRAVSFQMGFVGQQIPLGFQLVRDGVLHHDSTSLANGEATLDFWTNRAAQPSGLPLTWYNPDQNRFRNTDCVAPIFTRTVSDGMEGMTNAAIFMRQHNMPQPAWEKFAQAYGDWLVKNQNPDGSWYRSYNPDGSVFVNGEKPGCSRNGFGLGKFNTSNPVRFLVTLYYATGDRKYLKTAQTAGDYMLRTTVDPFVYVGGIIDNPNVIDKLAGVLALRAALALYDATHETKWLEAARKAANYTETWGYAWTFPIRNAPPAYRKAGAQSVSLIATGQSGADIELSVESYDFYRLHLLGDDANNHYLQMALYLESNTKLTTQLSGVPDQQFGFAVDGLVGEAFNVASMDYVSAERSAAVQWLPWLTDVELEPLQRQEDTFGSTSIREAEKLSPDVLLAKNRRVYPPPGSIGWGRPAQIAH